MNLTLAVDYASHSLSPDSTHACQPSQDTDVLYWAMQYAISMVVRGSCMQLPMIWS